MEVQYKPVKKEELSADFKKKYLSCRGCNVGQRRNLWREYIVMLRKCRRNGTLPDSYLYLRREDADARSESLKVCVGGKLYGTLGSLSLGESEDVMTLMRQECRFCLEVSDLNRVGEDTIPLVLNYEIPAERTVEAPDEKSTIMTAVPKIVDFACAVPYARVEDISPELAKKMLEHNTKNRNLNMNMVNSIANSIKNGHYIFTNQSIGFDTNGVLTDGQHRLEAIVLAGIAVPMVVVYGSNQSPYLDRGKKRTVSDNLTICYGNEYSQRVVGMLNHAFRLVTDKHSSMDEMKMQIAYDKIRPLVEQSEFAATFHSPKSQFGSYYGAAVLTLMLSGRYANEDIADMNSMFLYGMHAEGMPNRPQDSMIIETRDMIMASRKPFIKKSVAQDLGLDIEKTVAVMRVMIPYLSRLKMKKRDDDVKRFCKNVLTPFFEEVDEQYGVVNSGKQEAGA